MNLVPNLSWQVRQVQTHMAIKWSDSARRSSPDELLALKKILLQYQCTLWGKLLVELRFAVRSHTCSSQA